MASKASMMAEGTSFQQTINYINEAIQIEEENQKEKA